MSSSINFTKHSNLAGLHALLSPSNYHWVNYDEDKLSRVYFNAMAARRGTELHDLAANLIRMGVKLPRSNKTLNAYVNDAIGFRMTPEQPLFYSENCFGTADAISFHSNMLRIHDLKTGTSPASVHQLEIYAAIFCLEYRYKPFQIGMEFRIYQNDATAVYTGDPDVIVHVMDRIKTFDKYIFQLRQEAP